MENKTDIFAILNDHIGLICATLLGLSGLGAAPKIIKACKGVKDNYTYNTYNYPEQKTQPTSSLTPIESTHITRYKTAEEEKKEESENE